MSYHLSQAEEKAKLDASCKRLLSHKIILAWILKECLEEFQDLAIDEIVRTCFDGTPEVSETAVHVDESRIEDSSIDGLNTEDNTISEGTVTYDIRFAATAPGLDGQIGVYINIEAQNDFHTGYPIVKRGVYYGSRMISRQYGVVFTKSHYEKIIKAF